MENTYCTPRRFPPPILGVRTIQELDALIILGMTLEHYHRGNRAMIWILTPPNHVTVIMAIVEDTEGTTILL